MKRLKRRLLLWLFRDNIRAFGASQIIDHAALIRSDFNIREYVMRELAYSIGKKLLDDGFLHVERDVVPGLYSERITAKFYGIKLP